MSSSSVQKTTSSELDLFWVDHKPLPFSGETIKLPEKEKLPSIWPWNPEPGDIGIYEYLLPNDLDKKLQQILGEKDEAQKYSTPVTNDYTDEILDEDLSTLSSCSSDDYGRELSPLSVSKEFKGFMEEFNIPDNIPSNKQFSNSLKLQDYQRLVGDNEFFKENMFSNNISNPISLENGQFQPNPPQAHVQLLPPVIDSTPPIGQNMDNHNNFPFARTFREFPEPRKRHTHDFITPTVNKRNSHNSHTSSFYALTASSPSSHYQLSCGCVFHKLCPHTSESLNEQDSGLSPSHCYHHLHSPHLSLRRSLNNRSVGEYTTPQSERIVRESSTFKRGSDKYKPYEPLVLQNSSSNINLNFNDTSMYLPEPIVQSPIFANGNDTNFTGSIQKRVGFYLDRTSNHESGAISCPEMISFEDFEQTNIFSSNENLRESDESTFDNNDHWKSRARTKISAIISSPPNRAYEQSNFTIDGQDILSPYTISKPADSNNIDYQASKHNQTLDNSLSTSPNNINTQLLTLIKQFYSLYFNSYIASDGEGFSDIYTQAFQICQEFIRESKNLFSLKLQYAITKMTEDNDLKKDFFHKLLNSKISFFSIDGINTTIPQIPCIYPEKPKQLPPLPPYRPIPITQHISSTTTHSEPTFEILAPSENAPKVDLPPPTKNTTLALTNGADNPIANLNDIPSDYNNALFDDLPDYNMDFPPLDEFEPPNDIELETHDNFVEKQTVSIAVETEARELPKDPPAISTPLHITGRGTEANYEQLANFSSRKTQTDPNEFDPILVPPSSVARSSAYRRRSVNFRAKNNIGTKLVTTHVDLSPLAQRGRRYPQRNRYPPLKWYIGEGEEYQMNPTLGIAEVVAIRRCSNFEEIMQHLNGEFTFVKSKTKGKKKIMKQKNSKNTKQPKSMEIIKHSKNTLDDRMYPFFHDHHTPSTKFYSQLRIKDGSFFRYKAVFDPNELTWAKRGKGRFQFKISSGPKMSHVTAFNIRLPPGNQKEPESTGNNVLYGYVLQAKSLSIIFDKQETVTKTGHVFIIPENKEWSIENKSLSGGEAEICIHLLRLS